MKSTSILGPVKPSMSSGLNPLHIPHILSTVFANLSVFHLKKCRLICSLWAQEATPHLQKKGRISLRSKVKVQDLLSSPSNPSSFLQTVDIHPEVREEDVLEFFCRFGPSLTSLDLSFHTDYSSSLLSELPNLEELCINGKSRWLHEEDLSNSSFPLSFPRLKFLFIHDSSYAPLALQSPVWTGNVLQILKSSGQLERLFYAPFMEERALSFFQFLLLLWDEESGGSFFLRNLSHLHVNHLTMGSLDLASSFLQRKAVWPLRYFHIVVTHALRKEDLVHILAKLYATLRELTLTFSDSTGIAQFHPIYPLDKLTKLSFIGYEGPLLSTFAGNLNLFVMSLPNEEVELNPKSLHLNRNLPELEIYDGKRKYSTGILKSVLNYFQSLTFLKMNNADNAILRAAFGTCPNLTELQICFHKFFGVTSSRIDGGLTGFPDYRVEDPGFFQEVGGNSAFSGKDLEHLRVFPWVGGLKGLKVLHLELGHLTDFGVVLGITKCPKLEKLVLKNCEKLVEFEDAYDTQNRMTDLSLSAICEMRYDNLMYLKIEGYNDCFSGNGLEKAREIMEGIEVYFL